MPIKPNTSYFYIKDDWQKTINYKLLIDIFLQYPKIITNDTN